MLTVTRPKTSNGVGSVVHYVGPLGKEVDWLIHLWHAISLSASPLYYGRVIQQQGRRLLTPASIRDSLAFPK